MKSRLLPVIFATLAAATTNALADEADTIVVLGDSLSGAYGISTEQGWVSLLQQRLNDEGYGHHVVNASVSGDTSRTGLGRIDSVLNNHHPDIVIVALGGNDGLRGLPFDEIENSLAQIIDRSRKAGAQVLLVGVRLPPNYGPTYLKTFASIYSQLADRYQVPLVPRVLQDVADEPALMQDDGIHPTAEAQPKVMQNVWVGLKPMLKKPL